MLAEKALREKAKLKPEPFLRRSPATTSSTSRPGFEIGLTHHTLQALNSEAVLAGMTDILLNYANLWERLREKARTGA